MIWLTSDTHFNHKNICRGVSTWEGKKGTRDFETVEEMNEAIIKSINDNVRAQDILIHAGDFAFGDKSQIPHWRRRIRCEDVRFIYGNHDHAIRSNRDFQRLFNNLSGDRGHLTDCGMVSLHDESGEKHPTFFFHYCVNGVWEGAHKGWFHAFGHSHGSFPKELIRGRAEDIGWDVFKRPISEHEFCEHMLALPVFQPIDHHNENTNVR